MLLNPTQPEARACNAREHFKLGGKEVRSYRCKTPVQVCKAWLHRAVESVEHSATVSSAGKADSSVAIQCVRVTGGHSILVVYAKTRRPHDTVKCPERKV